MIEDAGIERVKIRSVLTCEARRGVCVQVLRARSRPRRDGEPRRGGRRHRGAVDRRAGHAAHDADLPHRRHGDAGAPSSRTSRRAARARCGSSNLRIVRDREGRSIVMNRNGEIGDRRRRAAASASATRWRTARTSSVEDGQAVTAGEVLARVGPVRQPDPHRGGGTVKFGDIVEGVTMQEEVDESTGLSSKRDRRVEGPRHAAAHLGQERGGRDGRTRRCCRWARYLAVSEGEEVAAGDVVAKIPRETTKTKDITGGLPRVAELFEARKPKESRSSPRSTASSASGRTARQAQRDRHAGGAASRAST